MRNPFLIALLAPLTMTACAAGPDYSKPLASAAAAGAFVTQDAHFDAAAALPDDWWRLYSDPVLDGLVARALAANTDLRVAAANLERANAALQESRAGRLPLTTLAGGIAYGDASQGGAAGTGAAFSTANSAQWSGNSSLSLAWEVDLFGRVRRTIEAARADAQAIEAARDAVRVTVAAETTRAYLDACAASYALDIARQTYATSGESLRLVTALERAGAVGRLDVERASAVAATALAAIPQYEGQRDIALFELAALLGTMPGDVPAEARACRTPPEPVAALPVGDGAALLRRRPDLREAERRLAADTARIGVATAALYPTVSLGGSGNFFRNEVVKGNDSFSFSIGPLISWSFPNVAVARARIRQTRAQGEASLASFDGRVLAALKEIEQALTSVATEQRRRDALEQAQESATRAHRLAEERYRAGSVAYLDVLVAQTDLLTTRAAYAASLQRLASARVGLFKALGGGWQSAPAASSSAQAPDPDGRTEPHP